MVMNKKGQGLSTNAIILIVLGVAILAVMILGFTLGWSKISPWISTNNVDSVKGACASECEAEKQYDFCTAKKTLKAEETVEASCYELSSDEEYSAYGIQSCPQLTC